MQSLAIDDTLLVAFVDGELDPTTRRMVLDQIHSDPALAERAAMFRQTTELLRAALSVPEQLEVPPALASNVARLVANAPSADRSARYGRRLWMSVAAAAAVAGFAIGSSGLLRSVPFASAPNPTVAHVLNEIADYHTVYVGEREHLVEVPAAGKEHLETWLGGRLQLAFQVPDLRAYDLEFKGGRLLGVDRQPVAQLMYTDKAGSPVALCIALTEFDATSPVQRYEDDALTLFGQGIGRHVFIVVGPKDSPVLAPIADAMPGLLKRT